MHHSRLCALLIDCNTSDLDRAASFWAEALGRPEKGSKTGVRVHFNSSALQEVDSDPRFLSFSLNRRRMKWA